MAQTVPVLLLAGLLLAGCQRAPQPAAEAPAAAATAASAQPPSGPVSGPEISAEDFAAHVKILASDEFEGRAPGTAGEQRTVDYLSRQFQRLGLQPGNGDSYLQRVPMISATLQPDSRAEWNFADGGQSLRLGEEIVIGTPTGQAEVEVKDSPVVFLGYGVDAPEADWNDYSVDVRGKTVVVLVNDPGFHAGDDSLFQGRRMTYYGRWSYKFEEAARKGAAAALVIHDDAGAGYGWNVVHNSGSGPQFDLTPADAPGPRLPAQGWLSAAATEQLFSRAGLDFQALRMAANRPGFKPVELPVKFSASLRSTIGSGESHNVMALLPGLEAADEALIYLAHWDHLGSDPALQPDGIYNGAADNASGVAGVLEIAEAFVTREQPPRRSVLFMAVTLEESGLLGSRYYAAHPRFPLAQTVAVFNLDNMTLLGPSSDMVVIGYGNSELEDLLRPIAAKQGRELRAETAIEKGFFYRSDHFNFAKAGVPALYAKGGSRHREQGEAFGEAWLSEYNSQRYHGVKDEFDPGWDLRGVVEDLDALYRVGRGLAESEQWPNWYPGNEFRAIRDAARATAAEQPNRD